MRDVESLRVDAGQISKMEFRERFRKVAKEQEVADLIVIECCGSFSQRLEALSRQAFQLD